MWRFSSEVGMLENQRFCSFGEPPDEKDSIFLKKKCHFLCEGFGNREHGTRDATLFIRLNLAR